MNKQGKKKKEQWVRVPVSVMRQLAVTFLEIKQLVFDLKQLANELEREEEAKTDPGNTVRRRLSETYKGRDDR